MKFITATILLLIGVVEAKKKKSGHFRGALQAKGGTCTGDAATAAPTCEFTVDTQYVNAAQNIDEFDATKTPWRQSGPLKPDGSKTCTYVGGAITEAKQGVQNGPCVVAKLGDGMKATLTVTGSAEGIKLGSALMDTSMQLPANPQALTPAQITAIMKQPVNAIFAMKDNVILAAQIEAPGIFHHSSLFSGQPVQCAGTIKTDATGKLLELTNDSGHYKPAAPCLFNVLHKLKTDGYTGTGYKVLDKAKGGTGTELTPPAWV